MVLNSNGNGINKNLQWEQEGSISNGILSPGVHFGMNINNNNFSSYGRQESDEISSSDNNLCFTEGDRFA